MKGNVSLSLGVNSNNGGSFLTDSYGHGTMVAGIIGAVGNNNIGISGVCWNVNLVSLRADGEDGQENVEAVINAINYAQEKHINILSFSGGFYDKKITEEQMIALYNAINDYRGLFICAAGNDGKELINQLYPQTFRLKNMIVVGSSTQANLPAGDSNNSTTR